MMKQIKFYLTVFSVLALSITGFSQDTLKIKGTQYVQAGEVMSLTAGAVVAFEPGATIVVEGGLELIGTKDNPIQFVSMDLSKPGNGITVAKANRNESIKIENVDFVGLIQPIRFDPFWSRKTVSLKQVKVNKVKSGEPVLFVASPLIDLRLGNEINLEISDLVVMNSNSGLLLEKVGASGLNYSLKNVSFINNNANESGAKLNLMHLDAVISNFNQANFKLEGLMIHGNYQGSVPVEISVSGGRYNITNGSLFTDFNPSDIVRDQSKDPRIPKMVWANIQSLDQWAGSIPLVVGMKHLPNEIKTKVKGNLNVATLLDEAGAEIEFTQNLVGDSLSLSYISGMPIKMVTSKGLLVDIPEIDPADLVVEVPEEKSQGEGEESGDKREVTLKLFDYDRNNIIGDYEIGIIAGDAVYGGGDIKWPKIGPMPMAPSVELSLGAFAEYAFLPRISFKVGYNFFRLSASNIYSPAYLQAHERVEAIDDSGRTITPISNYGTHFRTSVNSLEVSTMIDMPKIRAKVFKSDKIQTRIGLGIGVFHFTPYRLNYIDSKEFDKINLRKLGTEGQLFLPGKKPYSSIAINFNITGQLSYTFGRFRVFGDVGLSFTTTDYLDDVGGGLWYGGNYNTYLATAIENNPDIHPKEIIKASEYDETIASNSPRSTNNFTDYYFRGHIGISYNFGKLKLPKKPFN